MFCHTPHNAKPAAPLWNHTLSQGVTYQLYRSSTLKSTIPQPQPSDSSKLCLSCHDGTVALGDTVNNGLIPFQNVPADQKLPPSNSGNLAGPGLNLADDHPFAFVPDLTNRQVRLPPTGDPVRLDYQNRLQCKCHSYNPNKPQIPGYEAYGPLPQRRIRSTDLRLALASSVSWHPVTRPRGLPSGPGGAVPSLLPAPVDSSGAPIPGRTLSASSAIYCIDCHSNDTGRYLRGSYTGPAGPHGSNVIHILERGYVIESSFGMARGSPDLPYSSANYALCFKCHSEQSLRRDESFKQHWRHMRITSCATCHDPHGVPSGTATNNGSLINFDQNVVAPSKKAGGPIWTDLTPSPGSTTFKGSCTLLCHNRDHNNATY